MEMLISWVEKYLYICEKKREKKSTGSKLNAILFGIYVSGKIKNKKKKNMALRHLSLVDYPPTHIQSTDST